jgi:predicted ATPase/DNA-binding SARP family transcriptional activator
MITNSKQAQLHIELLGGFHLRLANGGSISLPTRKAEALVAYLACGQRPFPREELAAFFWSNSDPQQAAANLRKMLSTLRRSLAPYLAFDKQTVALQPGSYWLDAAEFTRLTAVADPHAWEKAVSLYRGHFLAGFYLRDSRPFDEWTTLERERWQRQMLTILRQLAERHLHWGTCEEGLTYVGRWLALDPLAEAAHRLAMRLHTRLGRRNAALTQYAACQRILNAELGVDPMPETARLYECIRAAAPRPLPYLYQTFVGRETELSDISRSLDDPAVRLLTITGPGGAGKTHLAQHAAARCASDFEHGVYFVSLNRVDEQLSQEAFLLGAIASGLNLPLPDKPNLQDLLLNYLRQKEILLLLDNFEDILAAAPLLQTILERSPQVKCLATSRLPLKLPGERVAQLGGLTYPEKPPSQPQQAQQYGALALFETILQQVAPDFVLTADALPDVIRICQLVDGLPLGLELAARAIRALTPAQIAAQLQQTLDFLSGGARDLPQRHRSLRFVFNYSWDLLSDAEQTDFAALTLFPAPFTEKAARAIAGVTAATLRQLSQKGLLQPMNDGRYQMHNLLRHYGSEKLAARPDEMGKSQAAYARYYADLLAQLQPNLADERQQEALSVIRQAWPHLRLVWQWSVQQSDFALLVQIISPACRFLQTTGLYQEAADLLRQTLPLFERSDLPLPVQRLQTRCMAHYGRMICRLGQYEAAESVLTAALAQAKMIDAPLETAVCYREQGNLATIRGQLAQAEQALQQSLLIYQTERDAKGEADVWHALGQLYIQLSQFENGRHAFSQSLARCRQLADSRGAALALGGLAVVAHYAGGDYREAQALYLESLAIKRTLGYQHGIAKDLNNLGNLACNLQEFEQAIIYYEESLVIKRDIGVPLGVAITLSNLGTAYQELGQYERAVALYRESMVISQQLGDDIGVLFCLANLAEVSHLQGEYRLAERQWRRALRLSLAVQTPDRLLYCMTGLASFWADPAVTTAYRPQAAAMLYYVQAHPGCNQSVREKSGRPLACLADSLPAEALAAAKAEAAAWRLADIEALLAATGEAGEE